MNIQKSTDEPVRQIQISLFHDHDVYADAPHSEYQMAKFYRVTVSVLVTAPLTPLCRFWRCKRGRRCLTSPKVFNRRLNIPKGIPTIELILHCLYLYLIFCLCLLLLFLFIPPYVYLVLLIVMDHIFCLVLLFIIIPIFTLFY